MEDYLWALIFIGIYKLSNYRNNCYNDNLFDLSCKNISFHLKEHNIIYVPLKPPKYLTFNIVLSNNI